MKNPKRLTREQKIVVSAAGLNADNWMLIKSEPRQLEIINKKSKTKRAIKHKVG